MWNLASAYGKLPSDIVGLVTPIARWQLDEACLMVGRQIENALNKGETVNFGTMDDGRRTMKYASANGKARKKVKIKADGTW